MKKVLIIEDEENLQKLYQLKIEMADFEVECANNGIEGYNKSINFKPDLILLDLMMPKQNGFDTLEQLKKNNKTKNIPVIILSNLGHENDIEMVMELGAKEHLVKSQIELDELVNKVKLYTSK
ncbi:response regulator [Candidatus Parcubacteria bacterium]|nr:MAG: response regulator [Candidatus Parcubacteria bacterium]